MTGSPYGPCTWKGWTRRVSSTRSAAFLADNRINIVDLKSTVKASPESGTAMYVMDIRVQIPAGTDMAPLEKGLSDVADELNVDITVSDA
jgi:glycine cleavage system transcriptional repressor